MNQIHKLAIIIFSLPILAIAQKKNYTMAEATNGLFTTLATQSIKQPSWQPETTNFCYVKDSFWIRTSVPSMKTDTPFTLSQLSKSVFGKDSLKSIPYMQWLDKGRLYFTYKNNIFINYPNRNAWISKNLPEYYENLFVSPNTEHYAYTVDNNLYVNGNKVTNDTNPNIINGKSVHRDEFGIDRGIFFSPQGNLVAYYKMDQTMVNDYPIIDWSSVPAKNNNIKYPMAGGVSHHVSLWVYNPESKKSIKIQTGLPLDQYLTCVTWSPDEKAIYIALLNRAQNKLQLCQFDIATGKKINTLFDEYDSKYVQPQHAMSFLPDDNEHFVWWSQRDGYMHLYLYNTQGKMIRQLTSGNWLVNEILSFNKKAKEIIISASKESPMEKHAYSVNWTNGNITRIDKEIGYHNFISNSTGEYLFDVYSSAEVPKNSVLRTTNTDWSKLLLSSPNPLENYDRPKIENITLKAEDGTPLYGKLILPTHFNKNKKYPVIVYLYNGPNVQLLKNSFPESGNLWYEMLAQKGYVVFTMDGRGSSNRGLKFEQATWHQLGTVELKDQLKGVDFLKSLPYVDANRMGIHGWSYGGFMTTSMMLRYPDVFKVGVAGGPVMDWKMYEIMYTERYMGTPKNNTNGYEDANLLTKTNNLKGKLLLIHGTNDDVVVWQHSIDFIRNCVTNNIPVDYFVYPGHLHNVRGKDRVHLMQKITDYFDLYLQPK